MGHIADRQEENTRWNLIHYMYEQNAPHKKK